jgi:hypothetical protein
MQAMQGKKFTVQLLISLHVPSIRVGSPLEEPSIGGCCAQKH